MSALEAASAGVKDMADGSLRITIEFDPRFAKEAFALFGARGTPEPRQGRFSEDKRRFSRGAVPKLSLKSGSRQEHGQSRAPGVLG